MTAKPSLPMYVGIGAFVSIVAVFAASGVPGLVGIDSEQFRLLVLLIVFSAGQTTLTYVMLHDWSETGGTDGATSLSSDAGTGD